MTLLFREHLVASQGVQIEGVDVFCASMPSKASEVEIGEACAIWDAFQC